GLVTFATVEKSVRIQNNELVLLPSKAVCWPVKNILLLADLHLGKVNHFRRSGIAAPNNPNQDNLERLITTIQTQKPSRVIFMGDLFHSHYNEEWEVFGQVLKNFPEISFELVMGNHDILSEYQYLKHAMLIHEKPIIIDNLLLSHEPLTDFSDELYNLAGHVHPGVVLRGKGRQGLKLPCFWFGKRQGLLPAFGAFTGLAKQKPERGDKVFVVVENEVFDVSG
ncbi:ligase-associated DNA damage response endonuclease PdeM, partial [Fulvivirga sp. RKSG066]|uniref:ligase-associated DNA damage response endonuclease PdeM n=1 Tax=Fulvivirga aurantia TaxID=2529383 RepID=UPI0012BC011B